VSLGCFEGKLESRFERDKWLLTSMVAQSRGEMVEKRLN